MQILYQSWQVKTGQWFSFSQQTQPLSTSGLQYFCSLTGVKKGEGRGREEKRERQKKRSLLSPISSPFSFFPSPFRRMPRCQFSPHLANNFSSKQAFPREFFEKLLLPWLSSKNFIENARLLRRLHSLHIKIATLSFLSCRTLHTFPGQYWLLRWHCSRSVTNN